VHPRSPPRNARREAQERLPPGHEARVLEPSPPALARPPYVEDPVARGDVPPGTRVVAPVRTGDVTWEELARGKADLAAFCAERWLGPYPRLGPAPDSYAATRDALHRLAELVISPTRQRDRGEITLRWTLHGFGTPFFGADAQLRVDGDVFVIQTRERVLHGRLTTLFDAAEFVGFDLTRSDTALVEEPLGVDRDAACYLGDVFGFATSVLTQLRAETAPDDDPGLVNLWPEHFDVAVDLGGEGQGRRATFGVSPGDAEHPLPYVYVSPWSPPSPAAPDGGLWNATAFRGAELLWDDVVSAPDQRERALSFLRERRAALAAR
jgi:hypothetical protein